MAQLYGFTDRRLDIDPPGPVRHATVDVEVAADSPTDEEEARTFACWTARDRLADFGLRAGEVRAITLRADPVRYLFEVRLSWLYGWTDLDD